MNLALAVLAGLAVFAVAWIITALVFPPAAWFPLGGIALFIAFAVAQGVEE